MTLNNTLGTVIGAGVAIYAVDAMFGRRRRGYDDGGPRRGARLSTAARVVGKPAYLKRYKVSWRVSSKGKSTVKSRIVLAKSADAARNLIKRDFGIPKSKLTVKNTGK